MKLRLEVPTRKEERTKGNRSKVGHMKIGGGKTKESKKRVRKTSKKGVYKYEIEKIGNMEYKKYCSQCNLFSPFHFIFFL